MTVETASYISQLDGTRPLSGDPKSEGDDHLRLIKSVLQTQFPNLSTVAMTRTAAQLNSINTTQPSGTNTTDPATTAFVQTQFTTLNAIAAAAIAAANVASVWVSGATYAVGDIRWSPLTYATYRCKVANSGTVDPSLDLVNWAPVGGNSAGSSLYLAANYGAL